jgi:NDP-sugar pyrophosphorylase family protein
VDLSKEQVKAVLLVGGKGTRLRSVVPTTPKPLAAVGDRPFLELLVGQLRRQNIRNLVMCAGYRAHEIEQEFGDGQTRDVTIQYSNEPEPLGTAGAVKFAQHHLSDVSDFLVMNGDSFMEIDFHELLRFHRRSGGIATMAVFRTTNQGRYGTVRVNAEGRVEGFAEKVDNVPDGLVNAGIYVFNRKLFNHIPPGPASLERDIFPQLIRHGIYALEQQGLFIDIGTPEDYARAQELYERLYSAAARIKQSSGSGDEKPG